MAKSTKTFVMNDSPKFGAELDYSTAEAYNLLATNIGFTAIQKDKCKIIGITSPAPQEGKSYTSINLAYTLAKYDNKVLLIDCDLRRPSISSSLNIEPVPGLSNILTSNNVEGAFHENLLHENLTVVTSGSIPPNPSQLISSSAMKELLDQLAEAFNYIILDLPPVSAVSDPLVVSKYIDGMVIIIKHDFSRKKVIQNVVSQLRFANAKILGFVYNGYSEGKSYYSKYKKHYNSYGSYASAQPSSKNDNK